MVQTNHIFGFFYFQHGKVFDNTFLGLLFEELFKLRNADQIVMRDFTEGQTLIQISLQDSSADSVSEGQGPACGVEDGAKTFR